MSWIISWFSNQMLTALDPLKVDTFYEVNEYQKKSQKSFLCSSRL